MFNARVGAQNARILLKVKTKKHLGQVRLGSSILKQIDGKIFSIAPKEHLE